MEASREQNLRTLLPHALAGTPQQVDALWESLVQQGGDPQRYALVATVPGRVRVVYGLSLSEVAENFRAHSAIGAMLYGADVRGVLDLDDSVFLVAEKSFAYEFSVEIPKKERFKSKRYQGLYEENITSGKGRLPDPCSHEDITQGLDPETRRARKRALHKATANIKGGVGSVLGGNEEQFLAQGHLLIAVGDEEAPTLYNVNSLHDVACMLRLISEKTQQLPPTGVPHLLMDLEKGSRLNVRATPLLRVKSPSDSDGYMYWSSWQK